MATETSGSPGLGRVRRSDLPYVDVTSYGAVGDGVTDNTAAIQAALTAGAGGEVVLPEGTFVQTAALIVPPYTTFRGVGASSILVCQADIEQVVSARVSNESNTDITLRDMRIYDGRTLDGTATRTKYQVRLTNPVRSKIINVETGTGAADTQANTANIAGVHLELFGGSPVAYCNEILMPWIRNGSLVLEPTDGNVMGGYVWGHNTAFGIKLAGNNWRITGTHVIPSPVYGAFYAPSFVADVGIVNCFIDGSASPVSTGPGINGKFRQSTFVGNTFWNISREGIYLTGADGIAITGNIFDNCNRAANSHHDIHLRPSDGDACYSVTATGNSHANNQTASNKGYCFVEDNTGGSIYTCRFNVYGTNAKNVLRQTGYAGSFSLASRTDAPTAYERCLMPYNANMNTSNEGTATVADGAAVAGVTHNLGIVPFTSEIDVQAADGALGTRSWWISDLTTTTFNINISAAASGSTIDLRWSLRLGS